MTRSLPALAAIAAASVAGVWIHAATRDGSRHAATHESAAVIETIEIVPGPAARSHAAPAPDKAGSEPEHDAPSTANSPPGAAMRVALDPVTGQLVAPEHSGLALTIEEMQNLARQETEGLVTIRHPDGSETLNHEGRFTDYSVIRIGPGGKPVFRCVHGRSGVEHALRNAAPVTPIMEDK